MKTRWLRILYVERKITILWHMIMSRTRGKGAYMFSTMYDGSLLTEILLPAHPASFAHKFLLQQVPACPGMQ